MPQLQPLLEVGGVMVIKGREGLGAKELEDYLRDFGEASMCPSPHSLCLHLSSRQTSRLSNFRSFKKGTANLLVLLFES